MTGHRWGDEDVDWEGIDRAAAFIGQNLRKWGRVNVSQYKEKWGTVRVYCYLGLSSWHQLTHPGYAFNQWPLWLWRLSFRFHWILIPVNKIILPYHKWLYRFLYKKAIERYPHLRDEILDCADWDELLEGL